MRQIPLLCIQDCISDLNIEAKKCFKAGDFKAAERHYLEALQYCPLREEASSIHNNLAHLYLTAKTYVMAYKHSTESIRLTSSQNAKVCITVYGVFT